MLRTPEEIIEIGFHSSRVVMMNEAHDGERRCIRTREVGRRVLPTAHEGGIRHLAMEALTLEFAGQVNASRRLAETENAYLNQPEMQSLIRAALDLGWTLIAYELELEVHLKESSSLDLEKFDREVLERELQANQNYWRSMEYTNLREEEQAKNLVKTLDALPSDAKLMVWCGNGHHLKVSIHEWLPMGYQFKRLSGVDPFVIDQNKTVNFPHRMKQMQTLIEDYRPQLEEIGGTGGFLQGETPPALRKDLNADAFLISIQNELE